MQSPLTGMISTISDRWRDHRDAVWAILDQAVVSLATFAIGILVARYLGIAAFGQFVMALIVVGLVQSLHHIFVALPMMTLAGLGQRSPSYFKTVNALSVLFGLSGAAVTAMIVIGVHAFRGDPLPWDFIAAAAVCCLAQCVHNGVRRMLFAQNRGGEGLALDVMRYAWFAVLVAIAWRWGLDGVAGVLGALGLSGLLSLVPFAGRLMAGRVQSRLVGHVLSRHWVVGRWVLAMPLVTMLHEDAVLVGVGALLGDAAAGSLRAGQYLLGATHFVLMAMENFLPTGAARALRDGGQNALVSYLVWRGVLFGIMVLGMIGLLAAAPGLWLELAFGPGHAELAPLLWVFAIAYVFIYVRDIAFIYFRTLEKTRVLLNAAIAGAVTALVLFYPLVGQFGVAGGAFVMLAAQAVFCIYTVIAAVWDNAERRRSGSAPAALSATTIVRP